MRDAPAIARALFWTIPLCLTQECRVRTCIIFNPTAKGEKARRFHRHLAEVGAQCALRETAAVEDARRLASEAVREGFEQVVAAGGDGTLNEVLNGIADVPGGLEQVRLGLLPLGTVNVFAREMGIPARFEQAWQTLKTGHDTRIDLPMFEYRRGGAVTRRYFAQLAGAGLDARAIERVEWQLKRRVGPLAYVVAGLKALAEPPARITVSDGQQTVSGALVLLGNGRRYGGEFKLFPKADLRDGLVDVCVFPRANWWTLLRVSPSLLLRRRLPRNAAQSFQTASLQLSSNGPTPLEVDGEAVGHLPAELGVKRCALRIVVP